MRVMVGVMASLLLASLPCAAQGQGTLRVKSDITAVEVFLDGVSRGTTPVTIPQVPAGTHRLTLAKGGYKDHVQQVEIGAGATAKLFIVMKKEQEPLPPLPAKYPGLHRHAFSFCAGEITVTSEALEYRGKDGKDVFHIPYTKMHAVSRSIGASADMFGGPLTTVDMMGLRIDAEGRSYTFWVSTEDPSEADYEMQARTKQLYELVNRLWNQALAERKASGKKS